MKNKIYSVSEYSGIEEYDIILKKSSMYIIENNEKMLGIHESDVSDSRISGSTYFHNRENAIYALELIIKQQESKTEKLKSKLKKFYEN